MSTLNEQGIIDLIEKDPWMMDILRAAEKLNLPDWWIGAGFVRGKVWDYLHGYKKRTPLPDVDLIYFDKNDFPGEENEYSTKAEDEYQEKLSKLNGSVVWSVTNQARMHNYHKTKPYKNSIDALSDWSETATCLGVRLVDGKVEIAAPYGIDDLVNLIVRPIPDYDTKFSFHPETFNKRVKEKEWLKKWPKLRVVK